MSKALRRKPQAEAVVAVKTLYAAAPWIARHHDSSSEIEAYVEAVGDWTMLAQVGDAAGVDAEATADFIVRAVNGYDVNRALIMEMAEALRRCLASGLSWDTRNEAEMAIRKAEQLMR